MVERAVYLHLRADQKRRLKRTAADRGVTLTALVTRVLAAYEEVGCPPYFIVTPVDDEEGEQRPLDDGRDAWVTYNSECSQLRHRYEEQVAAAYDRYANHPQTKALETAP